jgi:hypothetical protein
VTGQLHGMAASLPGKEPPVPIGEKDGWAHKSVWTVWRTEKTFLLAESPQSVAIPTVLSRHIKPDNTSSYRRIQDFMTVHYRCRSRFVMTTASGSGLRTADVSEISDYLISMAIKLENSQQINQSFHNA